MPRVIHFEIPAADLDRAEKFYAGVFGWKIEKWAGPMDYRLATTGPDGEPGINGAIMAREGPQSAVVNTVDVPSIDEAMRKVAAAGGKVLTPKMPVPGIGWAARCQDTEGNTFGLMQADPAAR